MKLDTQTQLRRRGEALGAVPLDLVAVVVVTLLADALVLAGAPTPLRFAAALPLLFFLPGYAVVAGLYPEPSGTDDPRGFRAGIDFGERLALSFGVSLALVPLIALGVWAVGLWVSPPVVAIVFTAVVLGGAVVGTARRLLRPAERRFSIPYGEWVDAGRRNLGGSTPWADRALNAALVLAVLLAVGAFGYGILAPAEAESYTSATLLTNSDGELTAAEYPSDLAAGESAELVLEVANNEGADQSYAVVVQAERVQTEGGSTSVAEAEEVDRFSVDVAAGETRAVPHEVATEMTGERIRLSYYLYRGEAPASADAASAYRHLYVWISVGS